VAEQPADSRARRGNVPGAEVIALTDRLGDDMPKPRVKNASRHLLAVILVAVLAPLTALTGPAFAQEEDNPPFIHYASVSPGALPDWGGVATVTVNAGDDIGISQAYADVHTSDGSDYVVEMPWSEDTNYTGYLDIPANYGYGTVSYSFSVTVVDTNGASTTGSAGQVDVEGQIPPDAAPVMSDPFVSPRELPWDGGTVLMGVTAYDIVDTTAYARVTDGAGGVTYVDLTPTTWPKFEGRLYVRGNTTSDAQTYSVEMVGVDPLGQSTTIDAGQLTVAASPPIAASPMMSLSTCVESHNGRRPLCARARRK
jgi:hypothetical protein